MRYPEAAKIRELERGLLFLDAIRITAILLPQPRKAHFALRGFSMSKKLLWFILLLAVCWPLLFMLGCTKFHRRFGIPLRTVQNWYYGERQPPVWLVVLIGRALEARP